jgi:spore maturation protein CgeB
MKKVIVLMEKYCDLNQNLGTTSAHSNIVGSLCSAEIEHQVHHYDEYLYSNNKPIDEFIIKEAESYQPSHIVCSYYPFCDPRNVGLNTFQTFRNMGIPVIFIWFDFGHEQLRNLALSVGNQVGNLNVVVDTFNEIPNFISMWVPQDERIFVPLDKTIDLSFIGTKHAYPTRQHYLNFVKQHFPIHLSGGQRENKLTIEEYATTIGKSKISLNFPDKPDGIIQAKCRIYETMLCGTLLLEKDNEAIKKWFSPFVHYVPFINENDLLDKVQYYLNNETERNSIVNNALEKMKTDYTSKKWWNTVLEQAK